MKLSQVVSNITQIINRVHADLQSLGADDHAQYLNNIRHDTTARHTLGTVVPHDTFVLLTDTPSSYIGQALLFARVNAAESAMEFTSSPLMDEKARAWRSALQSILNNTQTRIVFDTISYDPLNDFDGPPVSQYVVPVTGFYSIIGNVTYQNPGTTGRIELAIRINGVSQSYAAITAGDVTTNTVRISDILSLTVGDTIELWTFQITGATEATQPGIGFVFLSIHRLS